MSIGGAVGRAILACVDAVAAGALAGVLTFLFVPVVLVSTRVELAAVVAATVTGVLLAVAMGLAGTGRQPFPATRLVKWAFDRLPWWA